MRIRLLQTSAAATVLLAMTSTVSAFESNAVLERLQAQMTLQGMSLEAANVVEDGSGLKLEGVTLTPTSVEGASVAPINVGTVMLNDISDGANGGYRVGSMSVEGFKTENEGLTLDFGGAELKGYFIAGADETDPMLKGNMYEEMNVGAFSVGTGDKTAFSFSGAVATMTPYEPGETLSYDMTISDMMADFSLAPDAQTRAVMEALGYSQIKGEMTATGTWNTDNGVLTMKPMKIAAQDAADLSFELEMGGYTPALVGGMQEMQASMGDNPQAMSMAMLGLAQQLDLRQMAIIIDDNSLTGRLLDFFGSQQGMDRAGTVAFAKGMLPLGLGQLGNPAFAQKAAAAIGTYLDDPKSLRIEAAPADPVPFAQLMAGATTNPASLLDTLAVDVIANQ